MATSEVVVAAATSGSYKGMLSENIKGVGAGIVFQCLLGASFIVKKKGLKKLAPLALGQNMNMVEPKSCWDEIVNGAAADEEFESILNLLDFPMESLEGDGLVGEWDVSKSQFLGPIPTDTLMELPPNPRGKSGTMLPHPLPKSIAPDIPSEEMGVGTREMGYLYGQYRHLVGHSQV